MWCLWCACGFTSACGVTSVEFACVVFTVACVVFTEWSLRRVCGVVGVCGVVSVWCCECVW